MTRFKLTASAVLCSLIAMRVALAQEGGPRLNSDSLAAIIRRQSPAVTLAAARLKEAKAGQAGLNLPANTNPYLSLTAGPGYSRPPKADFEFMLSLQWPLDFTFSRTGRIDVANEMVAQFTANYADVIREETMATMATAIRLAIAHERYQLCVKRSELDDQLVHTAQIRQTAGTAADADVALARISLAQSQVLANSASAENSNLTVALAFELGLPTDSALQLETNFLLPFLSARDEPKHAELDDLLAVITKRPDTRRAFASLSAAQADVRLQASLGTPIPSVLLASGRGPGYQLSGGLGVPVPIYQRNQTARAISKAHVETSSQSASVTVRSAEAQVRSLHINYHAARQSFAIMTDVFTAITQAEHLALRSYELGQVNLTQALMSRRETMQARNVYLESKAAAAQAFVALQIALGAYDGQ
ncbi:MAG: TolC family protein [Cytophagaceae bacterium]|nr:MAG: TolC family protein [Cytophagaceae bacterium]